MVGAQGSKTSGLVVDQAIPAKCKSTSLNLAKRWWLGEVQFRASRSRTHVSSFYCPFATGNVGSLVPNWALSVLEALKVSSTEEKRMSAGKAATMAALVFIGVFFVATGLQGENSWASLITGAASVVAALSIYRKAIASN